MNIIKDDKLRKTIAKNGQKKYFKFFNSDLIAQYIIDKTFEINNNKNYLWHEK